MNKKCLKCGHINPEYDRSAFAECPRCHAIYAKVEAAHERGQSAATPTKTMPPPAKNGNLIACPDCGRDVSRHAPSCPNCGAPIAGASESAAAGANLVTTQSTSKRLKMHVIVAALLFFGGFASMAGYNPETDSPVVGPLLITAGLIWYVVTKVRIWWHHE